MDTETETTLVAYRLADLVVRVRSDQAAVLDYLDHFYTRWEQAGDSETWIVDSRLESPDADLIVDQFGVGHRADTRRRELLVRADNVFNLQVTTRKCLRDVMVAQCEAMGYAMIHASAVNVENLVIIFVGNSGCGKTTLALTAAVKSGYHYLANDHLIVYRDASGSSDIVLSSLPTLIPVRLATYCELEGYLPHPLLTEGGGLESCRDIAPSERYARPDTFFYTYKQLGQVNPVAVRVSPSSGKGEIAIVYPQYAGFGVRDERPEPLASVWPELANHIRTDWPFDPNLNRRYLPRKQRSPEQYLSDGRELAHDLAERAMGFRWRHGGDATPLVNRLREERGSP